MARSVNSVPSPFCCAQLLIESVTTKDARQAMSNHTLLPACLYVSSDHPQMQATSHLSRASSDVLIYHSCIPPSQETPHGAKDLTSDKSDHVTNSSSSPTGGWLLLSKQGITSPLSQNPQPPPQGHSKKDQIMTNSPPKPNTFGGEWQHFPKVKSESLSFLACQGALCWLCNPRQALNCCLYSLPTARAKASGALRDTVLTVGSRAPGV